MTLSDLFKVTLGSANDFIVCISKIYSTYTNSMTTAGRHMWAISTVVFDQKDCYNDAERDLSAIAKFLVIFVYTV